MRSVLQRLEAHQRQHGIAPEDAVMVVCGDFNSGRHETVCHFLHRGRLEGGTTEPHLPKVEVTKTSISHPYALHEAYSSGGHELPFTRKVPSLASTLDFIWVSCQMEVAALYWPVECRHEGLIEHQALPNQHYPSVGVEKPFSLRKWIPRAAANSMCTPVRIGFSALLSFLFCLIVRKGWVCFLKHFPPNLFPSLPWICQTNFDMPLRITYQLVLCYGCGTSTCRRSAMHIHHWGHH
ncbi:hypothetical protein Vretifemale_19882 [Volvox reticuliferus]|uniref:Uncharacterized protein n=1 Tax=Volvox reticuliferus TaxID=1737510 RepID=A0A8J4G141_9CHLO|nr:hypothetical protein Vretifemale_19882 [Volvox reticuliferus]